MKKEDIPLVNKNYFEAFAALVTRTTGSTGAFIIACVSVLAWLFSGPLFHYSNTWLLLINTVSSIVTFLMVFLIQKSQNKDSMAIQIKLNELLAAHEKASNRLVSIENLSEDDLAALQQYYTQLSILTKKEGNLQQSRSIDEHLPQQEKR